MTVYFFSKSLIPVRKGIRQGAITVSTHNNNNILEVHSPAVTGCIYRGLHVLVLNYALVVLNFSCSLHPIEENSTS